MVSANVTNTNVVPSGTVDTPYYDDYSENKNFYRILFRPKMAVQARELTQLQTMSQVQIERLGRHIFKNGSIVIGGQLSFDNAVSLNLASQYAGSDIDVDNFIGKKIIHSSGNNSVIAQVIAGENATSTEPPTLLIKYLTGDEFGASATIKANGENVFANVATTGFRANGKTASISDGIFFINGYFVRAARQTIFLDKYRTSTNVKIGLEFSDAIIDENMDASLRDPALESSNFQAPGAHRYQMELTLAKRSLDSTDDTQWIELSRISEGVQQKVVKTPIYSELEETFARRTYDESGNYTVRPFRLEMKEDSANSQNIIAKLDAGKAYVFGYEFETISPEELVIDRTLETETDSLYDISTAYGNYVITDNIKGFVDISEQPIADIHIVKSQSVNNANTNTYNSTKMGTTRIRNLIFDDAANNANGITHELRTYIFDTRITSITGNATGGTANTIILNLPTISAISDAYNRAIIRLTAGPGIGDQLTVASYNGSTKTATVNTSFSATPTANTQFSLDFNFKEAESLVLGTGGDALTANLDVALSSKDDGVATGNTVLFEPAYTSLVFPFPNEFIKDGHTINNYRYRKVFTGRSFTAGVGTVTVDSGESLIGTGALSNTIKLDHYLVIVSDPQTSGYVRGQVLSFTDTGRTISVAGATATFNSNNANNFTGDVIVSVEIDSGNKTNPKIKTLASANTSHITNDASNGSFISSGGSNATVYLNSGQIHIRSPNRIPSQSDSLYISDVKTLRKVYDLNGSALTQGASLASVSDVTSKFKLDTGQRDTHYDHGAIVLKSGVSAPKGPLIVCVDYYTHAAGISDGLGYMSVDSYPDSDTTAGYAAIPYYTDNRGNQYRLSDVIDFRPIRDNVSNTSPGFDLDGIRIPVPNEEFTTTYEHYLARKDLIVLNKSREFRHIRGIASQFPKPPNDPTDAMILYRLDLPPYVLYPANVDIGYVENKRYTMRDIGRLETRIQNVEYYTQLNFLEKDATDIVIKDANGLERTKYGIVADKFTGHQIGDITNPDYRCSMDFVHGELRPFHSTTAHKLTYASGDANHKKNGMSVTLNYSEADFIVQNTASKAENVQPYLIAKFIGIMELVPDNDIWIDIERRPDVIVNLTGANDAWQEFIELVAGDVFGTEWNAWQTRWTGSSSTTVRSGSRTTTTTTRTGTQTRTGLETTLNFDNIQESLGDKVLDVSVIPFCRAKTIFFLASNLRPTRQVFFFFDDVPVLNYVQKPNILKLTSNTSFTDTDGLNERIFTGANSAQVLLSRFDDDGNTLLYVTTVNGIFQAAQTITGNVSGNTASIATFQHFSGNAEGGTVSTINLQQGASNTANWYSGNTIYLTTGIGKGQNSVIQTYNATTRVATVSPSFSVAPIANTQYSIGIHKTTKSGALVGTFNLPSDDTISFRTGERIFRVIDEQNNDLENISTRADSKYNASGLLETKENQSISIGVPRITVTSLSETRPAQQVTVRSVVAQPVRVGEGTNVNNMDPLAQTFFVNVAEHPQGIFVSSVDIFFKAKDSILPVWVEIRPTVNGYPHSSIALPFSRKTLYPDQVRISDIPNAANSNTATTFTFSNPVYLEAGKEYALIVQTNSLEYEAFVSEMGKLRLGSNRIISEQPYLGSLFKSQNASTWTSFQFEDLMFVLRKCVFSTSESTVYFNNDRPTSNASMDWMFLQTNALVFANTRITYAFKATGIDDIALDSTYTTFIPDSNYRHDERKIIHNLSTGSINLRAKIISTNPDISPVLDLSRYNVIAIENKINNANLSNTNIVLTNDGAGYVSAANAKITIAGGNAVSSANAYVGTVSGGNVTSIIMDDGGSYYLETANITFEGGGATTNASGVIASELNPSGGPALSKYITRKVVLNEGFDAGDLRVYLTAYKPVGTELAVYYKVKSSDDPDLFENRPYVKMEQITPSNRFSNSQFQEDDLIEYEFRPSSDSNQLTYTTDDTTYNSFHEFAIKIVLLSDNTIVVPIVKDMRAIALPGSSE